MLDHPSGGQSASGHNNHTPFFYVVGAAVMDSSTLEFLKLKKVLVSLGFLCTCGLYCTLNRIM